MKRRLKEPFGKAGLIVAALALVFAMLGGAYAATNGGGKATASAKARQGKQGKPGKPGPAGPAGPQGPAGPAGPKGDTGAAGTPGASGTNGTTGTNGVSVTTSAATVGECPNGGTKFTSASPASKVCNGAPGAPGASGSPWTAGGTLPVNSTETGGWELQQTNGEENFSPPISFSIPLAAGLDGAHVVGINKGASVPATCDDGVAPAPSPAHPEADSGYLCIFTAEEPAVTVIIFAALKLEGGAGASTAGARVVRESIGAEGPVYGTWAVTG